MESAGGERKRETEYKTIVSTTILLRAQAARLINARTCDIGDRGDDADGWINNG